MLRRNNVLVSGLSLFVFCLIFYDFSVRVPVVEIVGFLFAVAFIIRRPEVRLSPLILTVVALLVVQLLALVHWRQEEYFLEKAFANNFFRLANIHLVSMIVAVSVVRYPLFGGTMIKVIMLCLKVICAMSVLELGLKFAGLNVDFQIPGLTSFTAAQSGRRLRSYGVFSEPSFLGLAVNVGVIILGLLNKIRTGNARVAFSGQTTVLLVLGVFCTLSLSQISIFLFCIVLFRKSLFRRVRFSYAFLLSSVIVPLAAVFGFISRINEVLAGQDGSSNTRIVGMLELARTYWADVGLVGLGLGQKKSYFLHHNYQVSDFYWFDSVSSGVNNTFLEIFLAQGLLGLIATTLAIVMMCGRSVGMLLLIVLIFSSGSHMNDLVAWFIIYLTSYSNVEVD